MSTPSVNANLHLLLLPPRGKPSVDGCWKRGAMIGSCDAIVIGAATALGLARKGLGVRSSPRLPCYLASVNERLMPKFAHAPFRAMPVPDPISRLNPLARLDPCPRALRARSLGRARGLPEIAHSPC
jgi:hypothetical protein